MSKFSIVLNEYTGKMQQCPGPEMGASCSSNDNGELVVKLEGGQGQQLEQQQPEDQQDQAKLPTKAPAPIIKVCLGGLLHQLQ